MLRPGGVFVFNVWDRIEKNEFADEVTQTVASLWPQDPPAFLPRTPHGYYNESIIQNDIAAGGFSTRAAFEALEARSWAASCEIPAMAYCQGTPLRNEIEARDAARLREATELATAAIRARFGAVGLDSKIRGYVITATKP